MIRFGPSGNSESFYAQGYQHTTQAAKWVRELGLTAYEYSLGRGIRVKEATAREIGQAMAQEGIAVSVHAPYYINLASAETEKIEKSVNYILESSRVAQWMGGDRIVVHPGSVTKLTREQALENACKALDLARQQMDAQGFEQVHICLETMGRMGQLGDVEEVLRLCERDERHFPAVDFAHIHARTQGELIAQTDFAHILNAIKDTLGAYRQKHMHIHFSHIEYTEKGEKMHRRFEDPGFGPDFAPLAQALIQCEAEPVIICESKGTMAEDACTMRDTYKSLREALKAL